ncbi:MAG: malonyl-[acyl-carrier protein] O-methyltransferase BioC, partial [Alcanivoracaceae bacterium]|nr:malonyl-[acyl-carrier protein] O-methyltransferase BioC [Alcanivoracaceae bacterium]
MSANALARTFGDSARSYDEHAQIQLAVNRSLLAMLPDVDINGWALDIGAGTAPVARPLQQRYPQARWLALDISAPMLAEAK